MYHFTQCSLLTEIFPSWIILVENFWKHHAEAFVSKIQKISSGWSKKKNGHFQYAIFVLTEIWWSSKKKKKEKKDWITWFVRSMKKFWIFWLNYVGNCLYEIHNVIWKIKETRNNWKTHTHTHTHGHSMSVELSYLAPSCFLIGIGGPDTFGSI